MPGNLLDDAFVSELRKVVRWFRRSGTDLARAARRPKWPAPPIPRPMMLIAKANMVADDTAYACKYLEADATEGADINCRRPNGLAVATGEIGFLGRDSTGQDVFIPAHSDIDPIMLIARANMPADDTLYNCKYLNSNGAVGAGVTCMRPNGTYVSNGDIGFLGEDTDGDNVFIPANMREEANMPLVIENRVADPGAVVGKIWVRTDL